VLDLSVPRLMGILNVTPDSFSDGGAFASHDSAYAHAQQMIHDGAAVLDVGGESTRPGAARVSPAEQIDRVCPVIERIRASSDVLMTIDTTRATVADAALKAGADAINDVSAGFEDPGMLALAGGRDCGIILMHRLLPPEDESFSDAYASSPEYWDVVSTVRWFLVERAAAAIEAGVRPSGVMGDPGLGFGKSVEQNYALMGRSVELQGACLPLLWGVSRKSFIGRVTGVQTPRERLAGSLAAMSLLAERGARLFRVHDVGAHREALAVVCAFRSSGNRG
jgi:dihydropteroate synthase